MMMTTTTPTMPTKKIATTTRMIITKMTTIKMTTIMNISFVFFFVKSVVVALFAIIRTLELSGLLYV